MAIVTPALIAALFTGFKKNFEDAKSAAPSQYTKIATVIQSTTKSNTYGWLGKFPSLRKWIGDRVINSMAAHGYTITNDDWESTVGVDRNDIEDDEIGIYAPLFAEMGRAAGVHPDEQVFALLKAGFTSPCFDGQYFFDTDHPVYPNADGTGTVVPTANAVIDGAYTGDPGIYWMTPGRSSRLSSRSARSRSWYPWTRSMMSRCLPRKSSVTALIVVMRWDLDSGRWHSVTSAP